MENKMILKISSKSNPNSVAGAIAGGLQENKRVELQAIGAGAVNQSMKAIAIARSFVAASGVDLSCIPAFCTVIGQPYKTMILAGNYRVENDCFQII